MKLRVLVIFVLSINALTAMNIEIDHVPEKVSELKKKSSSKKEYVTKDGSRWIEFSNVSIKENSKGGLVETFVNSASKCVDGPRKGEVQEKAMSYTAYGEQRGGISRSFNELKKQHKSCCTIS